MTTRSMTRLPRHDAAASHMQALVHKRLKAQEQRRNETRTHYLWRDTGESLQQVRERFRRMVAEGRANENDAYVIFRWQW